MGGAATAVSTARLLMPAVLAYLLLVLLRKAGAQLTAWAQAVDQCYWCNTIGALARQWVSTGEGRGTRRGTAALCKQLLVRAHLPRWQARGARRERAQEDPRSAAAT